MAAAALAYPPQDDAQSQPMPMGPQVGQFWPLPDLPQVERDRRQRIQRAWDAYFGKWGDGPLKVKRGQPDDNVRPNRCMPIVDTGVNFLFGEVLKIEIANETDDETGDTLDVDNGAGQGTSQAQAFLDACWGDDDDKMTLLTELGINGGVAGSGFLMIVPANPDEGEDSPYVLLLDSQNVSVITDPHNCRKAIAYWVQYEVKSFDATGKDQKITYRKVVERDGRNWLILDFERKETVGGVTVQSAQWQCMARTEWPYTWSPIEPCQNLPNPNEFWGLSDLPDDLIGMNKSLIFVESNTARIIKAFAHPLRYTKNIAASQIDTSIDNVLNLQSKDAEIGLVEAHPDLANSMTFADNLRANMDEQSQIPAVAFGRIKDLPRGDVSGVTLRTLHNAILSKTTKKRRLYGKTIRQVSQHFLELGKFADAAKARIELHWMDPLPSDDLAAAQTAKAWQDAGVSKDSSLQKGGWDPDLEADKRRQEGADAATAYSQGQGLNPMPPMLPGGSGGQPGGQPQQGAGSEAPPSGNLPPVNHPDAVLARQRVKAAFGK